LGVAWVDGKIVDLSKAIAGDKAGARGKISDIILAGAKGSDLVCSDRGLWKIAASGKLERFALPLKSQDVTVVSMRYPAGKGKVLVGIVPQQGGKVFEIDRSSAKVTTTGGYCGTGPYDTYYYRLVKPDGRGVYGAWAIKKLSADKK